MTARDAAATAGVACSFCGVLKGTPFPAFDSRHRLIGTAAHPHVARRLAYRIHLAARRRATATAEYRQWLERLAHGIAGLNVFSVATKMPSQKATVETGHAPSLPALRFERRRA